MIKVLLDKYRSYGIAKKILIILICGSVIPLILIEIIISSMAANTLITQTDNLVESNMLLSQKGVEDYFTEYDSIIMDIYTANEYAIILEKLNVWDSRGYYLNKRELEDDLQGIMYMHPEVLGMAVATMKNDYIIADSITNSTLDSYCFPEDDERWTQIIDATFHNTETIYSQAIPRKQEDGQERKVIYLAHRIADMNNYSQGTVGSIVLCLDEKSIRDTFSQEESDSNVIFLCDASGNIVSSSKDNMIGVHILFPESGNEKEYNFDENEYEDSIKKAIEDNHMMQSRYYSVYYQSILQGRFLLVSVRDNMEVLKNFKYIIVVNVLVAIIIILVSCLIMIRFANSIQHSVQAITSAMDKAYKGDYTVQIESERQDEFGKISRHFNHMVKKIDQSGRQEKEALIREKNAELKSLESQINPHFLYNTLDAINWVAIENEQFQISRMLKDLAIILRYSIHKSNHVVLIESEMEYLKKYIYLQQQRFSFSFHCFLDIDEEVKKLKMHKLLFQPLIENAIIHGFPGETGCDTITISIKRKDDKHLLICVADNGKGMDAKLVEELNSFDYRQNSIEGSIGVRNVIMRIKYYYGEEGTFHIESSSAGTCITAQILYEL